MARKKSKAKVVVLLLLVVVVGSLLGYVAFFKESGPVPIDVTVEQVARRTITQTVAATGKIRPESEVKISPETSGEIIYLGVREGDTVRKGQLLVRIKPDLVESQLAQDRASTEAAKARSNAARAEFERAKAALDRMSELYKKEVVSKDELEQSVAAMEQANANYNAALRDYERSLANLEQSEATAERTVIHSPVSGIVTALSVEEGEKVVGTAQMAGTVMLRIADLSVMDAVVDVDENDVVLTSLGDTARIEVDAFPDTTFNGVVYRISNSASTSGLGTQQEVVNFEVRIRLIDVHPGFRPGMSCNAAIETETRRNILAVPLQAVTMKRADQPQRDSAKQDADTAPSAANPAELPDAETVVFLKAGNEAQVRKVGTGISDNGFIEITSGLEETDEVITGSFRAISKELEHGSKINPAARDKDKKLGTAK